MESIEELKKELAKVEIQLKDAEKKENEADRQLKQNPEYISIKKLYREKDSEEHKLRKKLERIELNIKKQFTEDGSYPHYKHRDTWGNKTNILSDIFAAIRTRIDYTKLKEEQVVSIVNSLIRKELEKHREEIAPLSAEIKRLSDEQSSIYKKQEEIEERMVMPSRRARHALSDRKEKLIDMIAHPRKYVQRKQKNEERAKVVYRDDVTDEIYEQLQIIWKN